MPPQARSVRPSPAYDGSRPVPVPDDAVPGCSSVAASDAGRTARDRFASILWPPGRDGETHDDVEEPAYFGDLNLDQVVAQVVNGRGRYNLIPLFRVRAADLETIAWRHAVFQDLQRQSIHDAFVSFATDLEATRKRLALAGKLHDRQQGLRWTLNGFARYVDGVERFADALAAASPRSQCLGRLAAYMRDCRAQAQFSELADGTRSLLGEFDAIRYDLLVRGAKITVGTYDEEPDYSVQVLATFERFRQGDVADHHVQIGAGAEMDSIEAAVLGLVAQLHPELFGRLEVFCDEHRDVLDPVMTRLDREAQFYLAWLDYISPFREAGLQVSYPRFAESDKTLNAGDTYDIALAEKLIGVDHRVVTNDLSLTGDERILVVSGPNQGGKTTLARTFGQLYHLASLGCPVPGTDVSLHLPDAIFTHFEREEHLETLSGKLEDEVMRVRDILSVATGNSVVIMNEMFNSTTVADAHILSERVLGALSELDAVCLCVSFIDELSRLNDRTVSMVSLVEQDDPAVRTFKVVRRPADGRAYALAIADKYRLTFETLRDRVGANS